MSFLSGIGKALGGIGKAISGIADVFKGIMDSPLGNILKMAFPPLGMASAAMNFAGMLGNVAQGVGGGDNY